VWKLGVEVELSQYRARLKYGVWLEHGFWLDGGGQQRWSQ